MTKKFSQPVRRVIGIQFLGFIAISVLLIQLISPNQSLGADRHHGHGDRDHGVRGVPVLPPHPLDIVFLLTQGLRDVERSIEQNNNRNQNHRGVSQHDRRNHGTRFHNQHQYNQKRRAIAKARDARLRAARAADRGQIHKARKILAQAQKDLRRSERRALKTRTHKRETSYRVQRRDQADHHRLARYERHF